MYIKFRKEGEKRVLDELIDMKETEKLKKLESTNFLCFKTENGVIYKINKEEILYYKSKHYL